MKLEDLKKLCDQATPGPWHVFAHANHSEAHSVVLSSNEEDYDYEIGGRNGTILTEQDAQFIAEARDLLPKLLIIARLAGKIAYLRDWDEDYVDLIYALAELEENE